MNEKYSILIQWSEEDQKYVVSFPEFGPNTHTHGESREEAFKNALEVLPLLVSQYKEENRLLPQPSVFA